jgi:formylglycine-generating enzyme required for sulfatase activity
MNKITISILLLLLLPFYAVSQKCYTLTSQKGDEAFKNGNYQEAIKFWEIARKCSDKPAKDDLDGKIGRANSALKPKPKIQPPPPNKPKPNNTRDDIDVKPTQNTYPVPPQVQTSPVVPAKSLSFPMIQVQGGSFDMGSNDPNHYADERPVHKVALKGFHLSKYEITQSQWREVMNGFPEGFSNKSCDNCPMVSVSWQEIQVFLTKLNQKTGKKYRLPTEAEWEFAAKGGKINSSFIFSGGNDPQKIAWFADNSEGKIHPVGEKKANDLGIYDLTGNVQEWCQDFYSENYYKNSPPNNPINTQVAATHVVRGSSWNDTVEDSRLTFRISENPATKSDKIGFRVVLDSE